MNDPGTKKGRGGWGESNWTNPETWFSGPRLERTRRTCPQLASRSLSTTGAEPIQRPQDESTVPGRALSPKPTLSPGPDQESPSIPKNSRHSHFPNQETSEVSGWMQPAVYTPSTHGGVDPLSSCCAWEVQKAYMAPKQKTTAPQLRRDQMF